MAKARPENPNDGQVTRYRTPRTKRPRPKIKLQPPLIPMIDVTFLLLLYFILTTTFRMQEGQIPGTLPQTGGIVAGQTVELKPIYIILRPTGVDRLGCIYEIRGRGIGMDSPQQLYDTLGAWSEALGTTEVPVIIQPRSDVRWRYVVEAFNQAVRAKFKNIGFASEI